MGRPVVLRCRGGDRDTEGASGSSRPGNRPTHASKTRSNNKPRTSETKWPSASPALSEFQEKTQTGTRQDGPTLLQLTYIQVQRIHPHNAPTRNPVESRCPGETTRRWLGRPSPNSLVSEIAAISGVRDGHRNRKSQKSLRFQTKKQTTNRQLTENDRQLTDNSQRSRW